MLNKSRSLGFKIVLSVYLILLLFTLLVCLVPFIDSQKFWFISVIGLGFPFLIILTILFTIFFAIARSKWMIAGIVTLLLSWQQVHAMFAFHFFEPEFTELPAPNSLRILNWNVFRWDEQNKHAKGGVSYRKLMMQAVVAENADVLCLQEFFEPRSNKDFDKNIEDLQKMGYPYYYFFPTSIIWEGELQFGMAIFSRYPILDSAKYSFGQTPHSEGLMSADIKVNERIIRVFAVHLESSRTSTDVVFEKDGKLANRRSAISSMRTAYSYRAAQTAIVKEQIARSKYPVILCGNLGDLPNSGTYFNIKGTLTDAFLEKGSGFGGTYQFISPTIRIDYILASSQCRINQFKVANVRYSDHYPIVADVEFK